MFTSGKTVKQIQGNDSIKSPKFLVELKNSLLP
jgi:hypothetical protein